MSEAGETIYYSSKFRHGMDEKRRVQVPAKWRPQDPNVEFTLILWPHRERKHACLLVLPPALWKTLVGQLTAMSFTDPKAEALRRRLGTSSVQVALDKAGRLCLPEEMAQAAGIEKEAILVGLVDRFQIWNPERYQAVEAEDEALASEAFQLLN